MREMDEVFGTSFRLNPDLQPVNSQYILLNRLRGVVVYDYLVAPKCKECYLHSASIKNL